MDILRDVIYNKSSVLNCNNFKAKLVELVFKSQMAYLNAILIVFRNFILRSIRNQDSQIEQNVFGTKIVLHKTALKYPLNKE